MASKRKSPRGRAPAPAASKWKSPRGRAPAPAASKRKGPRGRAPAPAASKRRGLPSGASTPAASKRTSSRGRAPAPAPATEVKRRLGEALPHPQVELDFRDAWQLLVATILSAQSTDRTVNRVTPALFARYPNPSALAAADQAELEALVKPTGFFRNKAKAIRAASQQLVERHDGVVPHALDQLVELAGVARKTANVVLGSAYGVASGMIVDTHAGRVARRLGLTRHEDPVKVELDLCELFPRSSWVDMGHRFVLHGRYVCLARKPRCADCPLNEICPSREVEPERTWALRAQREGEDINARRQAELASRVA